MLMAMYIKVFGNKIKQMGLENIFIIKEQFIKEVG